MSTQPYGPMTDFVEKYKSLPSRALNAIEHPINTIESLLGFAPQAAPDPYMLHNDPDIAAANQSFRVNQPRTDAQLHTMSKPLVKK